MQTAKMTRFTDRSRAGVMLARELAALTARPDVLLLALPRGGVAVAAAMATQLRVAMDILLVRKLGFPGQPELAMGALAGDGSCALQHALLRAHPVPVAAIEEAARRERAEIARREARYRGGRPTLALEGRAVVLVDDGMATGATMQVALQAVRRRQPASVVAAVPVASPDACAMLRERQTPYVCLLTPPDFDAVGAWYDDFDQLDDDEVCRLLAAAAADRVADRVADREAEAAPAGLKPGPDSGRGSAGGPR